MPQQLSQSRALGNKQAQHKSWPATAANLFLLPTAASGIPQLSDGYATGTPSAARRTETRSATDDLARTLDVDGVLSPKLPITVASRIEEVNSVSIAIGIVFEYRVQRPHLVGCFLLPCNRNHFPGTH
jgi:hypothetical protein